MNKLLTARGSKKLLVAGIIILILSYVVSFISLWHVYSMAGDINNINSSALTFWQVLAKINIGLSIIGYFITALAIILMLFARIKKRKG